MSYDIDEIKKRKRDFFRTASIAFLPLAVGVGYALYCLVNNFIMQIQQDGIALSLLSLAYSLFWGGIVLTMICIFWLALFCTKALTKLNDDYCKNVFPQAVCKNLDYLFVKYTEPMPSLSEQALVKATVVEHCTFMKQSLPEYFVGRYRDVDFEVTQLSLEFGKRRAINGSVTLFDGFQSPFAEDDVVQVACRIQGDAFAKHLPLERGWEIKKQAPADHLRQVTITAPKTQSLTVAQVDFLEKLVLAIARQSHWGFYMVFSQGKAYFVLDGNSCIVKLPLWRSVENEIAEIEKSGILSVRLFMDGLMELTQAEALQQS